MEVIKLYQVDDWIKAYLKSWGYEDDKLVQKIYDDLKKKNPKNITPECVMNYLDGHVMRYLENNLDMNLEGVQKLNYFKMIFLMNKAYKKCQIFDQISEEENLFLRRCFEQEKYLITPDIIPANMFRQSIKTFHPIWQIKKAVAKGVQKIIMPPKKRKKIIKKEAKNG